MTYTFNLGGLVIQHALPPAAEPEPFNPVPQFISRAQGKAVLIQMGLWDSALSFVAAIPDPTERALAEVALHDTTTWQRNSPFLTAAALGLSNEQLDALFVTASEIEL